MQRLLKRWWWALAIAAIVVIDLAWLCVTNFGFGDYQGGDALSTPRSTYSNVFYHTLPTLLSAGDLTVKADLPVTNPWERKIRIEKVIASCGCTLAEIRDKELEAGAASSLHVEVKFQPQGGIRTIQCVLALADGGQLIHVFDAAAYPLVSLDSSTGAIDLGRLPPQTARSSTAKLLLRGPSASRELPTITSIAVEEDKLASLYFRLNDKNRSYLTEKDGSILQPAALGIDLRSGTLTGSQHAKMSITYHHPTLGGGTLDVPMRWYVEPVLAATPERVFLTVNAHNSSTIRKTFSVARLDKRPLEIRAVEASVGWARPRHAGPEQGSPGCQLVEVEIEPSEVPSSAYSEITVRTDCDLQPLVVIPVSVCLEK